MPRASATASSHLSRTAQRPSLYCGVSSFLVSSYAAFSASIALVAPGSGQRVVVIPEGRYTGNASVLPRFLSIAIRPRVLFSQTAQALAVLSSVPCIGFQFVPNPPSSEAPGTNAKAKSGLDQ